MQDFLKQLKFSHDMYGPIVFPIPNKNGVAYWKARSFIDGNGELKFHVFDKSGHSKDLYIRHDGTIGYFGNGLPEYVFDGAAIRISNFRESFRLVKSIPNTL